MARRSDNYKAAMLGAIFLIALGDVVSPPISHTAEVIFGLFGALCAFAVIFNEDEVKPAPHRWSGWPGAWCLDCGIEDPREIALANNHVDDDMQFLPEYAERYKCGPCPCPGSDDHNPYAAKNKQTETNHGIELTAQEKRIR